MITWMEQSTEGPQELSGLTDQQLRILALLAEGLTNKEIGNRLYLAEKTVKNHVTRILAKLGVQRRTQAALLASRLLAR
jgi:DNA-binding NarL/FixJ family response regulator